MKHVGAHAVLSYASADLAEAEHLEAWLQAPPRSNTVWRDRHGIPPGAPNYYESILEGIRASANFLVLLSPEWLRSRVSAQELRDAHALGKKLIAVVHPAIVRDPQSADGRARKNQLFEARETSPVKEILEPINWIWPTKSEGQAPNWEPLREAIATDFPWKRQHTIITQRLTRWQAIRDASAFVRGVELGELISAAFSGASNREPQLTDEEREFLLASQRYDAAERERTEALYAGEQARGLAFAARDVGDARPDTALLLAAEAASVAPVPEVRVVLGQLLDRHARLARVFREHGRGRKVTGVAFSPDGHWLASIDSRFANNDDRKAQLLVHEIPEGRLELSMSIGSKSLTATALASGERLLAVASPGLIGWLKWGEWKERFPRYTHTALPDGAAPDFIVFSPASASFDDGDHLAWGTHTGDLGVIRVDDRSSVYRRVEGPAASDALTGLAWLDDGRLVSAEPGRLVVRDRRSLEPQSEIKAPGRVFAFTGGSGQWVACCSGPGGAGWWIGNGIRDERFVDGSTLPAGGLIRPAPGPMRHCWPVPLAPIPGYRWSQS